MSTNWIIVGGGIAGAATAWALVRKGIGPGVVLEREPVPGAHASGKNAALAHQTESDPLRRALAIRSMASIAGLDGGSGELFRPVGSLMTAGRDTWHALAERDEGCRQAGLPTLLLPRARARTRFPFLDRLDFECALWSPTDGVLDIHALLVRYLDLARQGGARLETRRAVDELVLEGTRVRGVRVNGEVVNADIVIDASGAWAGRLGGAPAPRLPLQPFRRHIFVSGPLDFVERGWPFVWSLDDEFYFRPEGDGLLLSPCDETAWPAEDPPTDDAAAELLARKLVRRAPGLADMTLRRRWACLRTFAPDRRPCVGPDPALAGLYHVSALGGLGMTVSAAVGELIADIVAGDTPDWIDPAALAPVRLAVAG